MRQLRNDPTCRPRHALVLCALIFLAAWAAGAVVFLLGQPRPSPFLLSAATITTTSTATRRAGTAAAATAAASTTSTSDLLDASAPPDPRYMVLNLGRRQDRWRCTRREFMRHGIVPTRVPAVDATKRFAAGRRRAAISALAELSPRQKSQLLDDDGINTGHLATFLTHLSALRLIRDGGLAFGCVFEDDVSLVDGFQARVRQMTLELPVGWDLLVLSMYCHAGWKTCKLNDVLRPISAHLRPVRAFMSGAGYCLNARSAAKVLDTIPCSRGPCGVAIDGYLSALAQAGTLQAFRAISLPVVIPQDLMKAGGGGTPVHVDDKDCYSRYDSDIALWWKPIKQRTGAACVATKGEPVILRLGARRGVVRLPAASKVLVPTHEGEVVNILRATAAMSGGVLSYYTWHTLNVQNTIFVHAPCCLIVVSKDAWRGTSVIFRNIDPVRQVQVWWSEDKAGEKGGGASAFLGVLMRGRAGKRAGSNKAPTLHGVVAGGDGFEAFLPDVSRSLIVSAPGDESWRRPIVIQRLSESCPASTPRAAVRASEVAAGASCTGLQALVMHDLRGHDLVGSSSSAHARDADDCCALCVAAAPRCEAAVFRGDLAERNCFFKAGDGLARAAITVPYDAVAYVPR